MSDSVLITGGTGFIGRALIARLLTDGLRPIVLTRDLAKARRLLPDIECVDSLADIPAGRTIRAIVNLAGASVAGHLWTSRYKETMRRSRIDGTAGLVAWIATRAETPEVLVSASAIGFYGDRGDEPLTEAAGPGDDFGAHLCQDWESATLGAEALGIRTIRLRIGLVLGGSGGLLEALLGPLKLCLGAVTGTGRQWMSWIHMTDMVALIMLALRQTSMTGVYNATAPNPVPNAEFMRVLGRVWRRPVLFRLPAWPVRRVLGEMSEILLEGQRVLPDRVLAAGFRFAFPNLIDALEDIHA